MTELLLDPDILYWVVIPLFLIMVAAGLLRHNVMRLLQNDKQSTPRIVQRAQNTLRQTTRIRSVAAHYMTSYKWHVRKQHYAAYLQQEAEWCEKEQLDNKDTAVSDDPMEALMGGANPLSMMKGNMVFMVQNMAMMHFIQQFFSGFILLRVPFPLTMGFKAMFQRGLAELPDLDGSYVSSISWYFLVMYGLRSFFKLVIGEPSLEVKDQEMFQTQQQGLQHATPGKPQDGAAMAKQLEQEKDNMELFLQQHKSEFDSVEKRLLGSKRYPKKKLQGGADDDFLHIRRVKFDKSEATSNKKKV